MAKVVITGGAGYVGGFLTDQAVAAGHEVRVLDTLVYEDSFLKPVDFYYVDVSEAADVAEHYAWADAVVFLAGLVGDPACALNPAYTYRVNVQAVEVLLKKFGGRIVFPSTCSVYGVQDDTVNEDGPTSPLSLYAETKLVAERMLEDSGSNSLIFRLGTLYGLSDHYARLRADLVVNVLTIRAVLEGVMTVFGGQQYRPLLHVRDVSTAAVPGIESAQCGIFNLGSENTTILDLAKRVQSIVPEADIETTSVSFQDARNYKVSWAKAESQLNFQARWALEDGIREVAQVVSSRRIPDVTLPRYSNVAALKGQLK